ERKRWHDRERRYIARIEAEKEKSESLLRALHKDINSAAAIQRAFLPDPLLVSGQASDLEVFAEMRPAKEVGGDLYDFFFTEENKLVITVGDVVGKGIPAALFMAATQTVMRLVLRRGGHPSGPIRYAEELLQSHYQ